MSRILLIAFLTLGSWLMMMLVHESGHVAGAVLTGGTVERIVWHISTFSRTDVRPNPSPAIVAWAGPIIGSLVPILPWVIVRRYAPSAAYIPAWIAGFCLLANGTYIGIGVFDPVGDAREMIRLGSSRALMLAFGVITILPGLWMLHIASSSLGFGKFKAAPPQQHVRAVMTATISLLIINLVLNLRD